MTYSTDIATLEQENRQLLARNKRLEEDNRLLLEALGRTPKGVSDVKFIDEDFDR